MRLAIAPGYTLNTAGEATCETCGPRTSPTLRTVTHDDGAGGGSTYCRVHSFSIRADLGMDNADEVAALWQKADRSALVLDL